MVACSLRSWRYLCTRRGRFGGGAAVPVEWELAGKPREKYFKRLVPTPYFWIAASPTQYRQLRLRRLRLVVYMVFSHEVLAVNCQSDRRGKPAQMASSDDAENENLSCLYESLAAVVDLKDSFGLWQSILG